MNDERPVPGLRLASPLARVSLTAPGVVHGRREWEGVGVPGACGPLAHLSLTVPFEVRLAATAPPDMALTVTV